MLSISNDFEEEVAIKPFEVRESARIDQDMKKVINNAVDLTCLPKGDCILLLRSFKWNVSKMNDVYYDDSERYLQRAGTQFREDDPPEEVECEICCETTTKPIGLACGHYFCKDCWKSYLEERFNKHNIILDCPCMQSGCKCIITHDLVEKVSKTLADRYWYFTKKDYVESQGNVFCPNDNCGRAIIVLSSDRKTDNIKCVCNQRFCFKCLNAYHSPASCQDIKDWETVGDKDTFFLNSVKPCYHCGLLCERTHGCNHMTCPKCRGEWCWMCLGDWKTHGERTGGFYSCNIYNAGGSKGNELDKKRENSKAFHDKLQHYSDRYLNHHTLERQSKERKQKMMPIIRNFFRVTPRSIERLEESYDTLILARVLLKHTYVYGYFESEKPHSKVNELFNHQQAMIETQTEMLGELLFKEVETFDVDLIASKASTLRTVIDHFSVI